MRALSIAIVLVMALPVAEATPIRLDVFGEVSQVDPFGTGGENPFSIGDQIHASLTFDLAELDLLDVGSNGETVFGSFMYDLIVGEYLFEGLMAFLLIGPSSNDYFTIYSTGVTPLGLPRQPVEELFLDIFFADDQILRDEDGIPIALDLDDGPVLGRLFGEGDLDLGDFQGPIVAVVVPEPGTLPLLLSALLVLGLSLKKTCAGHPPVPGTGRRRH